MRYITITLCSVSITCSLFSLSIFIFVFVVAFALSEVPQNDFLDMYVYLLKVVGSKVRQMTSLFGDVSAAQCAAGLGVEHGKGGWSW